MKPDDSRREIKQILREGTLWLHEGDLDLTVEAIQGLVDREKVKSQLAEEVPIRRLELGET